MEEMIAQRYQIKRLIGQGGMADVFLARDIILDRNVAVKVLRGDNATDPVSLLRFQKEAMALASTSHPNIVEVYDVCVGEKSNYIVMEYVEGRTLKQLIAHRGSITIDESVNIMKQLVSAVTHAHKMGIIHRDIKSQNVLIKDDGTVKLSDFGIAYMNDSSGITQKETVMGSVHYIAPELAQGKKPSAQSDIYALGIVFYELLTSDVPFHGDSVMEIIMKHIHDPIKSVREINSNIPQSIENIIIKATAKDPKQRYSSALEMYNDICTCLDLTRNYEEKIDLEKIKEPNIVQVRKRKKRYLNPLHVLYGLAIAVLSIMILALLVTLNEGSLSTQQKVLVPNVIGYQLQQGKELLLNNELDIIDIQYEASDQYDKGYIISVSPNVNTEVNKGTHVSLIVSLGKRFTVDNYVGQNIDQVKALLEKQDFVVTVTTVEDSSKAVGTILTQSIAAGSVIEPTEARAIYFTVATYQAILLPNSIISMDVDQAKQLLEQLGARVVLQQLKIEDNLDENGEYIYPLNTVVSCNPACNTYYLQTESSSVTLYYY